MNRRDFLGVSVAAVTVARAGALHAQDLVKIKAGMVSAIDTTEAIDAMMKLLRTGRVQWGSVKKAT